ncbi:MAG TPA: FtsW/RodA/SpoVE family cell cycle protein [Pyrinomonadaceae bacterium]|nr:FtsW/RodA/SpoVE family cell cycle protein [Chloracidobacterium sp.]MBP9936450.1 FtsW/RodA/SpoVE family cell cycle protein [Pyrinomonadaceae bacterium]MBK9439323.1 FtsW/RodA/SpoVE family cell cycle protein [Chloracidobacterium sp.]MBL0239390.1 FtsW/RodA/SpoVE family cell cycle protein [Chloracidobacterium sp.]HQY67863.1 FtsW/RodA/SpoVE family cell cycle protein [Pyrinomonadaceae bacterium]
MKNRTSSHVFILLLIVLLTAISHYSIHYGALIRGYDTSMATAGRNLLLLLLLAFIPIILKKFIRFDGNWTLYTTAVLLFSIGLTVQYRLFSDPEYTSRKDKAEARQSKLRTLQLHYIQENYSAEKKQMMGLPATPPSPVDLSEETPRPADDDLKSVLLSGNTINPLIGIFGMIAAFILLRRDKMIAFLQNNGFLIVLLTLVPLIIAAITSRAGKVGNMTPWEPAKVPFLIGFAAILSVLYRNLARTYWGIPRAKDVVPLVVMAVLPFVPFFVLKDFGQMMVFSAVYATLYLVAVRRFSQRFVLVGSVLLAVAILVVGALPPKTQEKIPLLPTLAAPVKLILPNRIQQRFHLWLDGFDPPTPETSWWKQDYDEYYKRLVEKDPDLPQMIADDPDLQRTINVDAWFDILAFQPAQATFGLASGGTTGRGLGLGYPELIPVADSDYIFAALAEELGLFGGLLVTFALIVFVTAGIRTARDSRDMFSKLCAVGLSAFIGFQALVNIGGITRALPMTGITLPFVSHGGFSLITSFAMLGMLLAFSHRNSLDRRRDEFDPSTLPETVNPQ